MGDIVGFVHINKNATTCKGAQNPNEFIGQTCAVMEFGVDGCVMVFNPQYTALAMFDKEDVFSKFKCGYSDNVVTPPNLDIVHQMMYVVKAKNRKGGYNTLLRNMVIEASLAKGEFHDAFLWAKQ
jgi:hypothetical protein